MQKSQTNKKTRLYVHVSSAKKNASFFLSHASLLILVRCCFLKEIEARCSVCRETTHNNPTFMCYNDSCGATEHPSPPPLFFLESRPRELCVFRPMMIVVLHGESAPSCVSMSQSLPVDSVVTLMIRVGGDGMARYDASSGPLFLIRVTRPLGFIVSDTRERKCISMQRN